jgi:chemotaxis protein CheX
MTNVVASPIQSPMLGHLIVSTKAVCQTMLGWGIRIQETNVSSEFQPSRDVTGIIGLAGSIKGTIVVSVDKEVAFAAAEIFIGERPTGIDSDVLDLVGELANMIGGGAKERCETSGVLLGLPSTISGKEYRISFTAGSKIETVAFVCPAGTMLVQVALQA